MKNEVEGKDVKKTQGLCVPFKKVPGKIHASYLKKNLLDVVVVVVAVAVAVVVVVAVAVAVAVVVVVAVVAAFFNRKHIADTLPNL